MGEVLNIFEYPLTGARASEQPAVMVSAGGIMTNRLFVPYASIDGEQPRRIGQSKARHLAQLAATIDQAGFVFELEVTRDGESFLDVPIRETESKADQLIDEYGDSTPVLDCGDEAAEKLSELTGIEGLRLGQKTMAWQLGYGIEPALRRVAPLHVATKQTLEHIGSLTTPNKTYLDAALRFRVQLVLDLPDMGPFEESEIQELTLDGQLAIKRARDPDDKLHLVERCDVPGNDPETGEQLKDIPKLYKRYFPKSDAGVAVQGLYMYADLNPGQTTDIRKHQSVQIAA